MIISDTAYDNLWYRMYRRKDPNYSTIYPIQYNHLPYKVQPFTHFEDHLSYTTES